MYGLYITDGEQLADNHTAIDHDQPNCRSWEVYKGVLDGARTGCSTARCTCSPRRRRPTPSRPTATCCSSDGAKVDTKPQLEIFADDVKCTHGATVGRLDDVALFYPEAAASRTPRRERLLTYAFAAEVLEEVALEPVRLELERLVRERLAGLQRRLTGRPGRSCGAVLRHARLPIRRPAGRRPHPGRFPHPLHDRRAASRSSTSTAPPPARSPRR